MLDVVNGTLPMYEKEACKHTYNQMMNYLDSRLRPELRDLLFAELDRLPASVRGKETAEDEDVPTHLACPITLEAFKDPYIVISGQTYEKDYILAHIQKSGNVDPMTRAVLENGMLVPNRALFEACKDWEKHHKA